jgi:hypothetical protein
MGMSTPLLAETVLQCSVPQLAATLIERFQNVCASLEGLPLRRMQVLPIVFTIRLAAENQLSILGATWRRSSEAETDSDALGKDGNQI